MERLIQTPPEDYGGLTLVLDVGVDQRIAMLRVGKGGKRSFEIGFVEYPDQGSGADNARPSPTARGDLTRYSTVTEETFHKLHRLFAPLPNPDARAMPSAAGRRA